MKRAPLRAMRNLAGAKYGIYKGDELIDTYVTDADGKFTTKYYVCGTDWSIKELDSSEGYLVTPRQRADRCRSQELYC